MANIFMALGRSGKVSLPETMGIIGSTGRGLMQAALLGYADAGTCGNPSCKDCQGD